MAATPAALATRGELLLMSWPLTSISPLSLATAPVIILIRVDLPAPFSPIKACTSPAHSSKEASRRACTPAYDLLILLARSRTRSGNRLTFDDDYMQLRWSMDADGQRQFNVRSA